MDPSRFQRHVESLREANAAGDVPSITAALEDLSRATYRDYTIKSFLVEAGVIPALVSTSEVLPQDSTAQEANGAVALCLWGLCIGHRPNKIKLVEQGGLSVLIKGLSGDAHEDCAQYSALAVWSLCYSVPENQLAAAASIPALKALLDHTSTLVQYSAAGALWAVSSHPLNREQLVCDSRLLATLVRFLPKAPPPLDEAPPPEPAASLPAPGPAPINWRPVQDNRAVSQHPEEHGVARASLSGQTDTRLGESALSEDVEPSENATRSEPGSISRAGPEAGLLQLGALLETQPVELVEPSADSIERARPAESMTSSREPLYERDASAEVSTQTSPLSEEGRSRLQGESSGGGAIEGRHESAYREIRDSWLEATERLSENLQRQTDFLGRRTRRLRGLSGTAPSLSAAAAAASGVGPIGPLPSDGEAVETETERLGSGSGASPDSTVPRGVLGSGSGVPGTTETETVLAETMETVTHLDALETSVASGLGSESAGVWAAPIERDPPAGEVRPQSSAAIDELRSLVRAERARAESFVARARALVAEERAIRGNIGALERELAIAVRERDAAVRERDRTSAVLGRALAALSSARDQLAALGGTLRAANAAAPPRVPSAVPAGTLTGITGTAPGVEPEEYELLEMLDSSPGVPSPDPQQARKACLMACLLLGNLSLCRGGSGTMFEGERWPEAMAGVLRFVTGLGGLDAFWATMLWTTVQPLVDLLQSTEPAVQALSLFIVGDLCTGNEHKHKFIMEGAVPHLGRLCTSSSPLVRRLARNALLQLGMRPSAVASAGDPPAQETSPEARRMGNDDVSECVICCDEVSAAAFEPCGHVVSCLRVSPLCAAAIDVELEDDYGYREAAELDEEEEEREPARASRDHGTEERLVANEKMLQINKADFTVSSLLDKISRAKLNLKPAYQRDYVWDKKTASKLIESLLLNIPVPTMFFHEKERGKLEVVDGKQRLTSIWSFIVEERFPDGTQFHLTGLEVLRKLNGLLYSDLNDDLKESLQDYALNVHTISRHSDEDVVFEVFERLNMGSTQLNEQELRNCIYQGTYNSLLEDLVLDGYMLLAMHADAPHKRMRDRELLLRFFALRTTGVEGFMLPVKTWLNEQMRHNMDVSTEEAAAMKADFVRSVRLAVEVFGEDHVFRVLRPGVRKADEPKWDSEVNVALWDTVMFGFLQFQDDDGILAARSEIKKALMDLMTKDTEFRRALVSSRKALKTRCGKWNKALGKVLGSPPVRD
ncbi:hypothetical protein KFL_004380070 [Klebsormidium nitens]|uniref:GmrSD restriction endonucleases N-terminal domain-containing protein n=1 Tax=Klebsormidium nitens TaxID=105231 RepID=A0A1Y1IIR5_KLENI|nr:hypothetical protein KFL_004380070 [Klebsormidium nitens]|eukprot:GAQ88547.1 hypothetical protein KFL_004380070 [Klebsormidium nitens]